MRPPWPEVFSRNFTPQQILKIDYLLGEPSQNGFPCKPCGRVVTGSREQHFEQHVAEFKAWQASVKEERRLAREADNGVREVASTPKGEFYDHLCSCGAQIPRTGKRGRPPLKCPACREQAAR